MYGHNDTPAWWGFKLKESDISTYMFLKAAADEYEIYCGLWAAATHEKSQLVRGALPASCRDVIQTICMPLDATEDTAVPEPMTLAI